LKKSLIGQNCKGEGCECTDDPQVRRRLKRMSKNGQIKMRHPISHRSIVLSFAPSVLCCDWFEGWGIQAGFCL